MIAFRPREKRGRGCCWGKGEGRRVGWVEGRRETGAADVEGVNDEEEAVEEDATCGEELLPALPETDASPAETPAAVGSVLGLRWKAEGIVLQASKKSVRMYKLPVEAR